MTGRYTAKITAVPKLALQNEDLEFTIRRGSAKVGILKSQPWGHSSGGRLAITTSIG